MADISDNTNWFELDSANTTAPPNGWPEGQMPSTVNDCARAGMGAIKRFWNRINGANAITPSGGVYTLNTTNTSFPTAYSDGEQYKIRPASNSVGGDSFQVNALGAKPIWKMTRTSGVAIAAGDMIAYQPAYLVYNAALNTGSGAFLLANPFLPITQDNAGGIAIAGTLSAGNISSGNVTVSGGISATNTISSTGTNAALAFQDRTGVDTWLWYSSGDVARLWNGNQGGDRIWVTSNAHLNFAGPSGLNIYDDGNSHIESNNTLWLNGNTGAQVHAGGTMSVNGAMAVGSTGIGYTGIPGGHNFGFSWDGTAVHPWVDGNDLGEYASRSWVSGNFATSSALGGYVPLSGNSTISGGIYCLGNLGGNVGIRAALAIEADNVGTAVYAPNGNMVAQNFVPSDARLKTSIADSRVGLDAVLGLAPKTYKRIARPDEEELGLIAQEVAAVLPQAVSACELAPADANLGINYAVVTTALIGAVKELTARLATLEAEHARGE